MLFYPVFFALILWSTVNQGYWSYLQSTCWRGCWKALDRRSLCSSPLGWSRSCCRYWSVCRWRASPSWHWRTKAGHPVRSRSHLEPPPPPPDRSGDCWPRRWGVGPPALPPGCWLGQSLWILRRTRPSRPWTPPPAPGRCWQMPLWTSLFFQPFLSPLSILAPPLKRNDASHVLQLIQQSQTNHFSLSH